MSVPQSKPTISTTEPAKIKWDLELIAKMTPLVVGFLIFSGSLYLDAYYGAFGVNIFRYINISEILVAFLPITKLIVIIFSVLMFYFSSAPYIVLGIRAIEEGIRKLYTFIFNKKKSVKETKKWDIIDFYVKNKKGWLFNNLFFTITVLVVTLYCGPSSVAVKYNWAIVWIIFLVFSSLALAAEFYTFSEGSIMYILTITMTAFIVSTMFLATDNIREKLEEGPKLKTIIIMDKDTLVSTKTNYYLGRTNDYIFMYNKSDTSVTAISTSEVKSIKFK
jgi:hypothetical protein